MKQIDISLLIQSRYNSFTKTEQRVADFVLENKNDIISMSITDLAYKCNVGESSIFRFCKSLDLKGYQDFKIALVHSVSLENEMPQLSNTIKTDDTLDDLVEILLNTTVKALNDTKGLLNLKDIDDAVDLFVKSKRVYFYGVGASHISALEIQNKFMKITNKTQAVPDSHNQAMTAALMDVDDVAVIISYSGSSKDMIDLAKIIKKANVPLILITRYAKSPLTNYSDITLLISTNESPLQGGSITTKISQLYLFDILYTEYFKRTMDNSTSSRDLTVHALKEKLL